MLLSQRTGKNKKEERERGETHPPTLSHPLTGGLSYLAKTWVCQLVPNEQDMVYSVYMVLESFFTI